MQKITTTADLKNAIDELKAERSIKKQLLKGNIYLTVESLKPVNILKNTLNDLASSRFLVDEIVRSAASLAAVILSGKIVEGSNGNKFRKLIGSILKLSLTRFVAQNSDNIQLYGQYVFRHILHRKNMNQTFS